MQRVRAAWRRFRENGGTPLLGWIVFGIALSALVPFVLQRTGPDWERFRGSRSGEPISLQERIHQLNTEQAMWVDLSADFPAYYRTDSRLIHRPLHPAAVSLLTRLSHPAHFFAPGAARRAYAASIAWNLCIVAFSVLGFFAFLTACGVPARTARVAAALVATSPVVLLNFWVAAPSLGHLGITAAALWIFRGILTAPPGWRTPVLSGLLLGVLMLWKMHYDVLAAGWLVLAFRGRWRAMGTTAAVHAVPLVLWMGILALLSLRYSNFEAGEPGHGIWVLEMLGRGDVRAGATVAWETVTDFPWALFGAFGPVILLAAAWGGTAFFRERSLSPGWALLFMGVSLAFLFGIRQTMPYHVFPLFVFVYPMAARGMERLLEGAGETSGWTSALALLGSAGAWAGFWWTLLEPDFRLTFSF